MTFAEGVLTLAFVLLAGGLSVMVILLKRELIEAWQTALDGFATHLR